MILKSEDLFPSIDELGAYFYVCSYFYTIEIEKEIKKEIKKMQMPLSPQESKFYKSLKINRL